MVFFLKLLIIYHELYQFFFLFLNTLFRFRNVSLGFALKVIFRWWLFRGESKKFILDGSWWKLSQLIMVVQRFYHIEKYCLGIFSQNDLHNMDVQSWWLALHFGWVPMKNVSIHHGVIIWTLSIILPVFQNFDQMDKYCLGIFS